MLKRKKGVMYNKLMCERESKALEVFMVAHTTMNQASLMF